MRQRLAVVADGRLQVAVKFDRAASQLAEDVDQVLRGMGRSPS